MGNAVQVGLFLCGRFTVETNCNRDDWRSAACTERPA